MKIEPFTFNFKGRNSKEFGIQAVSYDFLLPEKRERKIQIPFTHGAYDYGKDDDKKFYNERPLRVRCIWASSVLKRMTRSDIRETAYWLSQKGKLEFPVEPGKYYVGEIYSRNELICHYDYARENADNENIETTSGEFELDFICEPFAYGEVPAQIIHDGINQIEYKGTAETPCTIILRNTNNFAVENVQIVVSRRRN